MHVPVMLAYNLLIEVTRVQKLAEKGKNNECIDMHVSVRLPYILLIEVTRVQKLAEKGKNNECIDSFY